MQKKSVGPTFDAFPDFLTVSQTVPSVERTLIFGLLFRSRREQHGTCNSAFVRQTTVMALKWEGDYMHSR